MAIRRAFAGIFGGGRFSRISLTGARERVRAGAALLDVQDPGWRSRIRLDALDLSDGAVCVLGQLHGEFRRGLLRTRIWDASSAGGGRLLGIASPEDLGFYAITSDGDERADLDYALLNRAWREVIGEGEASGSVEVEQPAAAVGDPT